MKLVDLKALFSVATTLRCKEGCYSFPRIVPLTLDPDFKMVKNKETLSTIFESLV